MAGVLASMRVCCRPGFWAAPRSRCFGAALPMSDVSQKAKQAHSVGPAGRPPQLPPQEQKWDIVKELTEAVAHNAELQSQLLAQSQASSEFAGTMLQSLAAAEAERSALRAQVDKLSTDMHSLTALMSKEQVGIRARVQRKGIKGHGGQSRLAYRPSVEDAEKQPTHVCEMSHQSLAELSMLGNHCAQRERLIREIMAVDGIPWGAAHEVLNDLDEHNEKYYWIESLPYRIGIVVAVVGGVAGTLMVFCKPVAFWYGENVAGEALPEGVADISELTTNQVGTWTWSWMEPMIGVASFVLLCCQFSRAQLKKMNMKTYGEHLLRSRADRLARRFPEYDQSMVKAWAKHMPRVNMNFLPVYEKFEGLKGPSSGL